jgi:hypothetical protein
MPEEILATVVDPDGRSVDLTGERRAHIADGHPELERYRNEVLETVRLPSRASARPHAGRGVVLRGEHRAESVAEGCRTL